MGLSANPQASTVSPRSQHRLSIETERAVDFVDVTSQLERLVVAAGGRDGIVVVQSCHTTTGLLINEHEPLLMTDLEAFFERMAPADGAYAHDDFSRRRVNVQPGERRNGHAHCRASLLRASETLQVVDGGLVLGRWQRVFLVDFDGPQCRQLAVTFFWISPPR